MPPTSLVDILRILRLTYELFVFFLRASPRGFPRLVTGLNGLVDASTVNSLCMYQAWPAFNNYTTVLSASVILTLS